MYPGDPFVIQLEDQLFTFRKDERGYVYLQIEKILVDGEETSIKGTD